MEKKRGCDGQWSSLNQTLLKMKLTTFILLLSIMGAFASKSFSQTNRLMMTVQDVRMEDFLKLVENQSSYRFFYSGEIDVDQKVSVSFSDSPINQVLDEVLLNAGITYEIKGRQVILSSSNPAVQTGKIDVNGTIKDSSGQRFPGVTVLVKGTTQGTVTDFDGNYTLKDVPADGILVFSFVGMRTEEMAVSGKSVLNITMVEDAIGIEEVVAVGYGTTSRKKLTSSISTIKTENLSEYPYSNTLQVLEGRVKGVFTMNSGGEPGALPTISIRGGGEPLYVIDGVPSSKEEFGGLSPTDIEKFSVLKDASAAAVYGARAGNGIVLVTTKSGKKGKKVDITYNGSFSLSRPTTPFEWLSAQDAAEASDKNALYNGGRLAYMELNENGELYWPEGRLDSLNQGILRETVGNTDWYNLLFEDYAPSQTHDISMSGGSESTKYFLSGRLSEQNGIFKNEVSNSKRYNYRVNLTHTFKEIGLTAYGGISFSQHDNKMPPQSVWAIMGSVWRTNRLGRAFNFEGNPTGGAEAPYLAIQPEAGYNKQKSRWMNSNLTLSWDVPFAKGVSVQVRGNYRSYDYFQKHWFANARGAGQSWDYLNNLEEMGKAHLNQKMYTTTDLTIEPSISYNRTFSDKHNVHAMFLYNRWENNYTMMNAARSEYESSLLQVLNAGPTSTATNEGTESEHARMGYVGRLKYDYDAKYMLEFNFRYDGSDKFPKGDRWGLFPSVSAGWNIDKESFMQPVSHIFSSLKLFGSWGEIGLDSYPGFGDFEYLAVFDKGQDFYQNGKWNSTLHEGALVSPDLSWYTRSTYNMALDFGLFKDKLKGGIEYFYYRTIGYLASPTEVYGTPLGKAFPTIKTNSAHRRAGWETNLEWSDRIGGINYHIGGNFSMYDQLWEKKYDEPLSSLQNPLTRLTHEKTFYGNVLKANGLYYNIETVLDAPRRISATQLRPGDVQYSDINGDGVIDDNDMARQGNAKFPRMMYGFNMGAKWNGVSLDLLFQGVGKRDVMLEWYARRFYSGHIGMTGSDRFWSPYNDDEPLYPRYTQDANVNGGNNSNSESTYWLVNGSYLRLKEVKINYDLSKVIKAGFVKKLDLYVSGLNLFTISDLKKYNIDPESGRGDNTTLGYPVQKLYNFGIIATF